MPWHLDRSQRTIFRSWFSSIWIPEIKLGAPGLAVSASACKAKCPLLKGKSFSSFSLFRV